MDADTVLRRIAAVLLQRAFMPDDPRQNGITLTTIARLVHDYLMETEMERVNKE